MLEIASLEGFYSKEPVQSSKRMWYSVEPYRTVPLENLRWSTPIVSELENSFCDSILKKFLGILKNKLLYELLRHLLNFVQ